MIVSFVARFLGFGITFALVATIAGCSDPVPPVPAAAFVVRLGDALTTSGKCPVNDPREISVGYVDEVRREAVTDGVMHKDNAFYVRKCEVINEHDPVHGGDRVRVETVFENGTYTRFSLSQTTVESSERGSTGTGFVSFQSPLTTGAYGPPLAKSSNDACVFKVIEAAEKGSIWLSFQCPIVVKADQPGAECAVPQGYLFVQYCDY